MGRKVWRSGSEYLAFFLTVVLINFFHSHSPPFSNCSGAGIGWMGSLDQDQKTISTTAAGLAISTFDVVTSNQPDGSEYLTSPPISDYVQSLLNANQQAQTQVLDTVSVEDLLPITETIPPPPTPSSKRTSILKNPFKLQHSPSKHA
jgi:hypothetical protein